MFFSVFIYLRVDDFYEDFVDKLMFYLFSLSLFLFINGPSYFLIYLLSKTFLTNLFNYSFENSSLVF